MIRAVIFDLDDTLYEEIDYCRSGFKAVAHFLDDILQHGQSTAIFQALWQSFEAGNHTTTFNEALDTVGIPYDDTIIRSLIRIYRNHKPNLRLPTSSRKVLDSLYGDYQLGLLTDGFLPAQRFKVRALGLTHWIQQIVYTEHFGREHWKPSPRGFERLMDNLDCPPESMVYIGDNAAKDFIAPNQLGMRSIQIRRTSGLHQTEPTCDEAAAQHQLEDLSELPNLLKSLPHKIVN